MKHWYVNVYRVEDAYGGPEEGGWWYHIGEFLHCEGIYPTRDEAEDAAECLRNNIDYDDVVDTTTYHMGNGPHDGVDLDGEGDDDYLMRGGVWGTSDLKFHVQDHEGRDYPSERPFYE